MPISQLDYSSDRVNFSGRLTVEEVLPLANNPALRTLQFESPVHHDNWPLLEEHLFSRRADVCLRAYGYDYDICDISFVEEIPSLQDFKADCLRKATGFQALGALPNLRHLSIGVDELDSFDFLSGVSADLKSLTLGPTLSTKPDISVVSRFRQLEELFVSGHHKGLQNLSSLSNLGKLRLSRLKSPDLDFCPQCQTCGFLNICSAGVKIFQPLPV